MSQQMTSPPTDELFFFAGPKAQAIIEALGLPAATQSITLRMTRGEFVEITCTYAPTDLDALVPHLTSMKFVAVTHPESPSPPRSPAP